MKKVFLVGLLFISINSFSQINSPSGNNYFIYNGLADVTMRFADRGTGGRAIVHDAGNILTLNYGGDFTGGTYIGPNTYFSNTGNSFINTGNVGIGTTAPGAKLDVGGWINGGQTGTIFGHMGEGNDTGDGTYLGVKGYETQVTPATYNGKSFAIEHHFYGKTNSSINFYRGKIGDNDGFMTFNTLNNTERMRIDVNGNVGIGTSTPEEKLEVSGNIKTGGTQTNSYLKIKTTNQEWWTGVGLVSGDGRFVIHDMTANKQRFTIGKDGNVGIGNFAPANLLSVKGTATNVEVGQYSATVNTVTTNYGAIGFNNTAALLTTNYALSGTATVTNVNAPTVGTTKGVLNLNIADAAKVVINSTGTTVKGTLNVNGNTTLPSLTVTGAPATGQITGGRVSLYSTGVTPDGAYNGNLFITQPATTSGQYINLTRQGNFPWSIGTVYGQSTFAIGQGTTDATKFTNPAFAITTTGNIGFGESNPTSKIVIREGTEASSLNSTGLGFNRNVQDGAIFNPAKTAWQLQSRDDRFTLEGYSTNPGMPHDLITVLKNGNTGIGTLAPAAKLDVAYDISGGQTGTVFGRMGEGNGTGDGTYLGVKGYETQVTPATFNGKSFALEHHFYGKINSSINFYRGKQSDNDGFMTFNTLNNTERMRIDVSGNVLIGTTTQAENSLLTVNGKITAEEVEIKDVAADFVFQKDYQLKPLHEVESYINENQHLPGVAPASETVKGVELSKFNTLLLQKVEELTLYMIQLKKENEVMKAQIKAISKQ
jgi:hypothetical protein